MRKLAFVFICVILAIFVNTALGLPGSGTQEDPWRIESPADFNEFAADPNYWDDYTRLETDVNLAGQTYYTAVIAPDTDNSNWYFDGPAFTGVFDGNDHKITGLTIDDGGTGNDYLGLFGKNGGEVRNLGLEGGSVKGTGGWYVGGLVGGNGGSVSNCYSTGSVSGNWEVGGLVGRHSGIVSNCYSSSDVSGDDYVGGLVGGNGGSVSNCYSTGSVSGNDYVGGLMGFNWYGSVSNCYSAGDVSGTGSYVGGLVGENRGSISNCYSTGDVNGTGYYVGGLVGYNRFGSVSNCFWDTDTQSNGVTESIGGNQGTVTNVEGLPTADMQIESTFADAGWDFVDETANGTDDIWLICQGRDYPKLWWQFQPPVLKAEPQESIGTGNVIMWSAVSDANAYWVECAEDANFQYVVDSSGWISQTSYVFFGLETGVTYWYRVKAGYYCDIESWWSNVESSTQVQLADAVLALLEPNDVKNENMLQSLANKLDAVQGMMDKGQYKAAISKLENDILQKTDGCAETGAPDKNDWITTCERQELVYPIIIEVIKLLSDG